MNEALTLDISEIVNETLTPEEYENILYPLIENEYNTKTFTLFRDKDENTRNLFCETLIENIDYKNTKYILLDYIYFADFIEKGLSKNVSAYAFALAVELIPNI